LDLGRRRDVPHARSHRIDARRHPALVGIVVGRMGEPLRSVFTAGSMRTLLGKYGFRVERDEDFPTIARAFPSDVMAAMRHLKHARIVTADRLG
jgi:hypothetical protein